MCVTNGAQVEGKLQFLGQLNDGAEIESKMDKFKQEGLDSNANEV